MTTVAGSETRTTLLRAAGELLEEEGLEAITLREVGRRAGLSRSAPYRHFSSKQGLLTAVAAADLRSLGGTLEGVARDEPHPLRRVQRMLEAYLAFARRHPQRYKLIYSPNLKERGDSDLREAAGASAAAFAGAVGLAIEAGALPLADPRELAALLVSSAHGAADLDRLGHLSEPKWGTDADRVAALLVRTLSAAAPSPGSSR